MQRSISAALLAAVFFHAAHAADIYVFDQPDGVPVFTDIPLYIDDASVAIEAENIVDFRDVPNPARSTNKQRRRGTVRTGRQTLTLDTLRERCSMAAERYELFRTAGNTLDWSTYKSRRARYAERRAYWCERLAKRR